ncbi:MAG: hypothetical protein NTW08_05435 [Gammaproteobacteria bacterium]|nr:hypothetical protein [Gammaproteobacteria bacterium]
MFGRNIYTSPSGYRVYQNIAYRWLSFGGNIIQTRINRHHPERGGLCYINAVTQFILATPGECCLLGLGGAGIAHALFPALGQSTLTAVEASSEVIDIATRYFYVERLQTLTIIGQRAETFVQSPPSQYRSLLVDLHDGIDFPKDCLAPSFWQHCRNLLCPDGMMVVNILNAKKSLPLFKTIQSIFKGCTLVIPIANSNNTLIIAYPTVMARPHEHLLSRKVWNEHWGWVGEMNF